jgi:hypothetical protein
MTTHLRPTAAPVPIPIARRVHWGAPEGRLHPSGRRYTQGALALTFPLPSGLDTEPTSHALSVVSDASDDATGAPDPAPWVSRFVQAVVEVVANERPLTQLARWTDPQVFAEIAWRRQRVADHRAATRARPGRQVVATVHISTPERGVAEVAARVTAGTRSRAIAARLDYRRDRWLCTAIDFG